MVRVRLARRSAGGTLLHVLEGGVAALLGHLATALT